MHDTKIKTSQIYKRSSHELIPLEEGENIRFQQDSKLWKPGHIINRLNDRSFVIKAQNGGMFRRNRRHKIKSNEKPTMLPEPDPVLNVYDPKPVPTPQTPAPPQDNHSISPPAIIEKPKQPCKGDTNRSNPTAYITRSGRISKPRQIIDMLSIYSSLFILM